MMVVPISMAQIVTHFFAGQYMQKVLDSSIRFEVGKGLIVDVIDLFNGTIDFFGEFLD